jgi:uncharacterized membrane protein YfcA
MKQKILDFSILFAIQLGYYAVWCVNSRAVADTHYHTAAISDFMLASIQFFVIRHIAHGKDHLHEWAGYASGSVAGSYLGIWISATFLNG